jgi:hypothetical protein
LDSTLSLGVVGDDCAGRAGMHPCLSLVMQPKLD